MVVTREIFFTTKIDLMFLTIHNFDIKEMFILKFEVVLLVAMVVVV